MVVKFRLVRWEDELREYKLCEAQNQLSDTHDHSQWAAC